VFLFPDFSVVSWGEVDFIAEFGLWRFGLFGVSRRFGEIVGFRKKLGAGGAIFERKSPRPCK